MPISLQCSGCGGKFRAPDEAAGRRVKCPQCSAFIEVKSLAPPVPAPLATSTQAQTEPTEPQQAFVGQTPTREQAREQLKCASDAYLKAIGKQVRIFGPLMLGVIVGGVIVCILYSWLWGVLGGIGVLVGLVLVTRCLEAPHKARAKQTVANVENDYGLTHDESLRLLFSETPAIDSSDFKPFVTEVWGADAVQRIRDNEKKSEGRALEPPQTAPEKPEESGAYSVCAVEIGCTPQQQEDGNSEDRLSSPPISERDTLGGTPLPETLASASPLNLVQVVRRLWCRQCVGAEEREAVKAELRQVEVELRPQWRQYARQFSAILDSLMEELRWYTHRPTFLGNWGADPRHGRRARKQRCGNHRSHLNPVDSRRHNKADIVSN